MHTRDLPRPNIQCFNHGVEVQEKRVGRALFVAELREIFIDFFCIELGRHNVVRTGSFVEYGQEF